LQAQIEVIKHLEVQAPASFHDLSRVHWGINEAIESWDLQAQEEVKEHLEVEALALILRSRVFNSSQ